jgi:hypothetical protein
LPEILLKFCQFVKVSPRFLKSPEIPEFPEIPGVPAAQSGFCENRVFLGPGFPELEISEMHKCVPDFESEFLEIGEIGPWKTPKID